VLAREEPVERPRSVGRTYRSSRNKEVHSWT
jgi:hypothetical protein